MDWLNIHTSTMDSEDFLGCEPVDQATWLKLSRYCIGQENGGRIATDPEWGDRRWQQVFRVTMKESRRKCALWHWEGDTLVVHFYPVEKEDEVRRNRKNGTLGGRPAKPKNNQVVSDGITTRFDSAETEGKGKEEEGKGSETGTTPAPPEQRLATWIRWMSQDSERQEANREEIRQLVEQHGMPAVQAKAEQLAHAAGAKVYPNALSDAFLAKPAAAEPSTWTPPALNLKPRTAP